MPMLVFTGEPVGGVFLGDVARRALHGSTGITKGGVTQFLKKWRFRGSVNLSTDLRNVLILLSLCRPS